MKPSLLLLLALSSTSIARIGESGKEIGARYGQVKSGNANMGVFELNGVKVTVMFAGERSVSEEYTREEPFSDREIQVLLAANSGTRKWLFRPDTQHVGVWQTQDDTLVAIVSPGAKQVLIQTREYFDQTRQRQFERENPGLKGF